MGKLKGLMLILLITLSSSVLLTRSGQGSASPADLSTGDNLDAKAVYSTINTSNLTNATLLHPVADASLALNHEEPTPCLLEPSHIKNAVSGSSMSEDCGGFAKAEHTQGAGGSLTVTGRFLCNITQDWPPPPFDVSTSLHDHTLDTVQPVCWGSVEVVNASSLEEVFGLGVTGSADSFSSHPAGNFSITIDVPPEGVDFYVVTYPEGATCIVLSESGTEYLFYVPDKTDPNKKAVFHADPGQTTLDVGEWNVVAGGWRFANVANAAGAWRIHQSIVQDVYDRGAWDFMRNDGPNYDVPPITVRYKMPDGSGTETVCSTGIMYVDTEIYTRSLDIIQHEYAHWIMYNAYGGHLPENIYDPHNIYSVSNANESWTEGWAEAFPCICQSWGKPFQDCWYEGGNGQAFDIENSMGPYPPPSTLRPFDNGDKCEGRVAGALWDIYDDHNDGFDTFQNLDLYGFLYIWSALHSQPSDTYRQFYDVWRSMGYDRHLINFCSVQNTINYNKAPVLSDGIVDQSVGTSFTWFTFRVKYQDEDWDPAKPVRVNVWDGNWVHFDLTSESGDPANGQWFSKQITGFSFGDHSFYFEASDDIDWATYPSQPYPKFTVKSAITLESIEIESDAAITDKYVNEHSVGFTVSGESGGTGYALVTIPNLNTSALIAYIDDYIPYGWRTPVITTNGTHWFIYLVFTFSTHTIRIQFASAHYIYLESYEDNHKSKNLGTIDFDGSTYNISDFFYIIKLDGTYQISYTPAPGYAFDHWDPWLIDIPDIYSNPTTVTFSKDGTLTAVYRAISNCTVHLESSQDNGATYNQDTISIWRANEQASTYVLPNDVNMLPGTYTIWFTITDDYRFDHWETTPELTLADAYQNWTSIVISGNGTIRAVYSAPARPVHNLNTGLNYASIQDAIDAPETLDGHTIFVEEGTYRESISLYKSVSLIGENRDTTIISVDHLNLTEAARNIIEVSADNVKITGFTINGSWFYVGDLLINRPFREDNGICLFSNGNNVSDNAITVCNSDIWLNSSSYNNIIGNHITNTDYGIRLEGSDTNSIVGNDLKLIGLYGICLNESSNNNINANNITHSTLSRIEHGVYLVRADNNTVSGNNIPNSERGVILFDSSENIILGNNITDSDDYGIWLSGSSSNSILRNNIADVFSGRYSYSVGIFLAASSNNNSIVENDVTNKVGDGIVLESDSDGNNISRNNIANNWYLLWPSGEGGTGIKARASNNIISENNIAENGNEGVCLNGANNTVSGNSITNNGWGGIFLERYGDFQAEGNNISGNKITGNYGWGIVLGLSASNNSISGNNITSNNGDGIYLGDVRSGARDSSGNSIVDNNIANNDFGIWVDSASGNSIFHNYFTDNGQQAVSTDSINIWDDGYPSGGNYWSDYTGDDFFRGPYQNVTGRDNRGDTPYIIDTNNRDHYPLLGPYIPLPTTTYALTITTTDGGTTDPAPGTITITAYTTVNVTATPGTGYQFDHWMLDDSPAGSDNPVHILMDTNHTLQAVFTRITYTLTITTSPGGTTDPIPGSHTYDAGTDASVQANPDTYYFFDHWELDGINVGSDNPINITMDKDHAIQAFFAHITYTLTITTTLGGTTNPAPATYVHDAGSTVSVTSVPDTNYLFDHWELDGASVGAANPIDVFMDKDHALHAVFTPITAITYTLTISTTSGGKTDPPAGSHTYDVGTIVSVSAIADPCYRLDYWELDGTNIGSTNPYSITMDKDHALKAVFSGVASAGKVTGGGDRHRHKLRI